jgi:hypothetical protein
MAESLKLLDEITVPDPRSAMYVVVNLQTGEQRPITLDDYYQAMASLELNESVPEHIRDHFLTARHLAIYAWFVYRFTMAAQLQAHASLEYALRERLGYADDERPPALRKLLNMAVRKNLFRAENFRDWPGHQRQDGDSERRQNADSWVAQLPEFFSYFRNDLAHGSSTLFPMHGVVLRTIADAINQLYPATT